MTDEELDAPMELEIIEIKGHLHCAYLNNFRLVGGKPWEGLGPRTAKRWTGVTIREIARAIPSLRKELGLDYLGRPVKAAADD